MLKDITLGQYFPGDTFVHRLDPRTKIVFLVFYIVALFTAKSAVTYGLVFVFLAAAMIVAKIKVSAIVRGLKPLFIVIAITAILNLLYSSGNVILQVWKIKITDTGVRNAVFMILRITFLITGTLLLTYTTSPISLTDGLESLLKPLKKIKVPVHELAMMMSIALRFIPTLIEETDKIMSAQKARGADFETGSIVKRAKALIPILVPLFVSAFRRADELAVAMESRCYHGGEGRTKMYPLKMSAKDYIVIALGALLCAACIVLGIFGI